MEPQVRAQLHPVSGRSSKVIKYRQGIEAIMEVPGVGRWVLNVDSAGGYTLRAYPEGEEAPCRNLHAVAWSAPTVS
jgi:hypothetical protein